MEAGLATDVWKRTLDHYHASAAHLLASMRHHGFMSGHAIPIDPNGELLNGSHRLACALALEMDEVPIERHTALAWAPAWDRAWFVTAGMTTSDLADLEKRWQALHDGNS